MMLNPPPFAVALHINQAIDALYFVDEGLADAFTAMYDIALEDQSPLDQYDLLGLQAICRLFMDLFSAAKEVGPREACPGLRETIAEHIEDEGDNPANPPGLELAALALEFALTSLERAVDATEQSDAEDQWYDAILAGHAMFKMVSGAIACGTSPRLRSREPDSFDVVERRTTP
jgi:hypothetical protein